MYTMRNMKKIIIKIYRLIKIYKNIMKNLKKIKIKEVIINILKLYYWKKKIYYIIYDIR